MCSAWEFREMTHKRWQLILVAQHIKQTVTFQSCVVTERRSPVSWSNTLWAGMGGATDHGKPTVGRTKLWRYRWLPLRTSTAPIYQALGMVSEYYVIISKGGEGEAVGRRRRQWEGRQSTLLWVLETAAVKSRTVQMNFKMLCSGCFHRKTSMEIR